MLMYPDAVWYNFNMMYETLDEESQSLLRELKEKVERSPKGRALQTFAAAIECTLLPQSRYLDGLKKIKKMFPEKGASVSEVEKWKKKRHAYCKILINDVTGLQKPYVGKQIGKYQREFARKNGSRLKSKLQKVIDSQSGLRKLESDEKEMLDTITKKDFKKKSKVGVEECSEWFSTYDPDAYEGGKNGGDNDDGYMFDADGDVQMSSLSSSSSSSSSGCCAAIASPTANPDLTPPADRTG